MIVNFKNKGLKLLWTKGDKSKLPPQVVDNVLRILNIIHYLDTVPEDLLDLPFFNIHPLKGDLQGTWALNVTKNWRITFKFDNSKSEAIDVDFEDYH